jgi:putative oxidoreductase
MEQAITPGQRDPLSRWLADRSEAAYTFLRVIAGLLFAFHGAQKLFGILFPFPIETFSQIWFGGLIELVCGLAIAVGAKTSWAAFLASGTMAVAYVQFHWKLQLGSNFLPAVNQGEPALVYAVLFLYMACRGSGRYSVDARL